MAAENPETDERLSFDVATVWREERVSCPHPDVLRAWLAGGLPPEASEFVEFHLNEAMCPYCNATVDELRAEVADATAPQMEDLKERLLRSTVSELRARR